MTAIVIGWKYMKERMKMYLTVQHFKASFGFRKRHGPVINNLIPSAIKSLVLTYHSLDLGISQNRI